SRDWSSDVCSSDLGRPGPPNSLRRRPGHDPRWQGIQESRTEEERRKELTSLGSRTYHLFVRLSRWTYGRQPLYRHVRGHYGRPDPGHPARTTQFQESFSPVAQL